MAVKSKTKIDQILHIYTRVLTLPLKNVLLS